MKNMNEEYILKGYEDLEISTQIIIRAAQARGVRVEVLERESNFLRLSRGEVNCIVKEATRTHLDPLITHFIMENKTVAKTLLREAGLHTPAGRSFPAGERARAREYILEQLKAGPLVIKPNTTNFGLALHLLNSDEIQRTGRAQYVDFALENAFTYSQTVIVEEYIPGHELRFLVVGDECVAVCKRLPANVTGDGRRTIEELVAAKNDHPMRGVGYKTPLEKIRLGDDELAFLGRFEYTPKTVPAPGQPVYLRWNSNISTGGDSIDLTDETAEALKKRAIHASQTLGAKICGVDLVTADPSGEEGYSILEVNFNPVLYIHDYPLLGKNRRVGEKILDALGFK